MKTMFSIKTSDPRFWFEIQQDAFTWAVEVCEEKDYRDPKPGKGPTWIDRDRMCFGPLKVCMNYVWTTMAKRKEDCKDIKEFLSALKEMHEELLEEVSKIKLDKPRN